MGSDLYMDSRDFHPRPPRAEWDGADLVILTDAFYHGYGESSRFESPDDKDIALLEKALKIKIPARAKMFKVEELTVFRHADGGYFFVPSNTIPEVITPNSLHMVSTLTLTSKGNVATNLYKKGYANPLTDPEPV